MNSDRDLALSADFYRRAAEARAHLLREMEVLGLNERDGWKIAESVRQRADGRCELHMRPLHMRLKAPPGVECVVSIDPDEEVVSADCTP